MFKFNTTPRLNDLLMKLNMKMGLFKSNQTVNVDFDHVLVKTEKSRCDIFGALYISIIKHFYLVKNVFVK